MPELARTGIAAIGESVRIEGYALAGVATHIAEDIAAARHAWSELPEDVRVVILTPAASEAVRGVVGDRLVAVLP